MLITQNSKQNSSNSIYARCIKNLPLSLQQYFCWQVALKRRVIFSVKCFRYIGRAGKKLIGVLRKKKKKERNRRKRKKRNSSALWSLVLSGHLLCFAWIGQFSVNDPSKRRGKCLAANSEGGKKHAIWITRLVENKNNSMDWFVYEKYGKYVSAGCERGKRRDTWLAENTKPYSDWLLDALILLDRLDRYVSDYMSLIQQSFRVIPEFHPLCEASLRVPPLCLSKPEHASEL